MRKVYKLLWFLIPGNFEFLKFQIQPFILNFHICLDLKPRF